MLSYAPAEAWQPKLEDTFERTSSSALKPVQEHLRNSLKRDFHSEFLTMLHSFDQVSRSLSQLSSMQENWSAYESPMPTAEAINNAREMLSALFSARLLPKRVLPSAEGGVAFVFTSDSDNRASMESLNNDEAFIILYDRQGNAETLDWMTSHLTKREALSKLQMHLQGTRLATT